jgi:hypothetical protein
MIDFIKITGFVTGDRWCGFSTLATHNDGPKGYRPGIKGTSPGSQLPGDICRGGVCSRGSNYRVHDQRCWHNSDCDREGHQFAPTPLKPAIMEYISHRNDISKLDFLDFLMTVMKTDQSLTAVEYAGRYFTQQTDQNIKPMALDFLITWWSEHRRDFEGK